ncbi:InlB B-repeat-containing protein [uncultured Anaerococcus sp.]|uniref:InlB B-repeat-containing protein n=1 Tax=uncultured Anaerococcus sp. TaxID=293428 RepID=UPI002889D68C|nr:InlB B-repeat-containing protein [uncultured Anaerococcus sp.]
MKNKKSSILVAALSISFILTSQSSFAQDAPAKAAEVEQVGNPAQSGSDKEETPKTQANNAEGQENKDRSAGLDGVSGADGSNKGQDAENKDETTKKEEGTSEAEAEEFHFTDEQKERLRKAGFSVEKIEELEKSARSKKLEAEKENKTFDIDAFIDENIKAENPAEGQKDPELDVSPQGERTAVTAGEKSEEVDALTSATYYKKANWENKIKDKSRWKVEDDQKLVRVSTSDPVEMTDINYDGNFVDANGRTVLRLTYKEKGAAATGVWYRGLFNFGDLDEFIDYDKSYLVGVNVAGNENANYPLTPFKDGKGRMVDLGKARGDLTNQRKNLPINIVLKEGVTLKDLGGKNYIVQMRLTDAKGERVYSYAPKGTSMDYSTYTKTTSVSLEDKVNALFIKGGKQDDGNNATAQSSFMSEFIANPKQYDDKSNLGIIRTQYTGQRAGSKDSPTVGGEQIAFTQAFDAKLLEYLKEDDKGNVAYVNILENTRKESKWTKNVGIKKTDFNKSADGKLAYLVIGTKDFQKEGVNVVKVEKHDQYDMIQGYYITAIDYVVDKSKFDDTFAGRDQLSGGKASRKLNYSVISGWTNPNKDGWVVYEKEYPEGYRSQEGESYLIDTTSMPEGGQIMIQIGDQDAIIRKQQGNYTYYITSDNGIEKIEEYAKGVFKFTLREGATVKQGDKLKVYMPYTKDHKDPVNFLEINNGTKLNEGAATLTLQKDRNINMHLYKEGKKGYYILKYTLADGTKASKKFEPKITWSYDNKDKVMTGVPNGATLSTGGNFYINTSKLKPGSDIFVESYDENGNKLEDQTSWLKYRPLDKSKERVENLTWTDSSDTSSILSINKSLYTPYQHIFTNDIADGEDDTYKDPNAFDGTDEDFNKDTTEIVGYTKYDGGKIRLLYEEGKTGKLLAKGEAASNEYDDKGNLKGKDVSKQITIAKKDIFDPHFKGDEKTYTAYEYRLKLAEMTLYHSDNKDKQKLELKKDMKFVSTASDGSSLASDLLETRVRTRILFDATDGAWMDSSNSKRIVKIAPDNVKFYGEKGYQANGFEGANVAADTGDKFPDDPKLAGKSFLGWVTAEGKAKLGSTTVSAEDFNKLSKEQIFTAETPIVKHQVVYAVYSADKVVTFNANGGNIDGKDQTTVKVEGDSVTAPADPTKEGYTFKGWADSSHATESNANLSDIKASKTLYAVWEKTEAEEPLTLTDPEKVEVKDLKGLTSDEKDKVADAVIAANGDLELTKENITVGDDGTVTVTKDGKTGTLAPEKTVTQKEVQNEFNPPKEPVKVENKAKLTDPEKQAVKDAVKAANPDRNLKDDEITVGDDGKVTINQNGKTGEIPADKTVVQKDSILKLEAPDKTEVKDVTDLTPAEKDKVAAAVKAKNNLADGDKIEVDNKGNVTVTTADGKKTGTLEGKDTVKPFDRAGKTLNDPKITPVSDLTKLTDYEKNKVRDAVKAANPDLDFKDEEIQVADDGTVTVPMGTDGNKTIEPKNTVTKDRATDNKIALKAPEKTPVQNINELTAEEKEKVKEAVKKANPDLPDTAKIEVADDGSVIVTDGGKTGALSQNDTVVDDATKLTLNKPRPVKVKDPQHVTADEQAKIKEAVKAVNPGLTDDQITVDDKGNVTVSVKEGETTKTAKLGPEDTIEKDEDTTAPAAPTVDAKADGSVEITPPANAKEVSVTYTPEGATDPVTVTATKDPETGKWTVPAESGLSVDENGKITIPADKVKDGTEVIAKAKDASNKESEPGKATTPSTEKPAAPTVTAKDDGSVEITPPANAKEVSVTYTQEGATEAKTITITKDADGKWKLPDDAPEGITVDPATGKITILADKVKDGTEVSAKAKDKSGNESKAGTADAKAPKTPGSTGGSTGGITIPSTPTNPIDGDKEDGKTDDKTGGETDGKHQRIPNLPDKKIKVKDDAKLTEDEINKVIDAVKKANPDAKKVEMDDKGNIVLTYDDGFEAIIPYKSVVAKVEQGSVAVPSKDKANAEAPQKGNKQMNQEPSRDRRNQAGAKNAKTGVGSVSGLVGVVGAALAGLFATKKKEDEDK